MFGISGGSFGGSGVKKYSTVADLPLTGVKAGTLAHVEQNLQGDSALYLWNGTQISGGWYRVATVNLAPNITSGPESAYALPTDGSPLVLTLAAEDPEGLPISWSFQSSEGDPTGIATISQSGGTFTIAADPAALAVQTAGAFSLTFVASDGVSLSAATSVFTLTFVLRSKYLAVGQVSAPYISVFDVSGEQPFQLPDPTTVLPGAVLNLAWHPDRRHFFVSSGGSDPSLRTVLFSVGASDFSSVATSGLSGLLSTGVSFSPDGNIFVKGNDDIADPFELYEVIDIETGQFQKLSRPAEMPTRGVQSIAWSADGRYLAVGSLNIASASDLRFSVYDFLSGSAVRVFGDSLSAGVNDLVFTPENDLIVVGTFSGGLRTYSVSEAGVWSTGPAITGHSISSGWGVDCSPDGEMIAISLATAPNILLYRKNQNGGYTVVPNGWQQEHGRSRTPSFSADSEQLAFGVDGVLYTLRYDVTGAEPVLLDSGLVASTARAMRYSPGE